MFSTSGDPAKIEDEFALLSMYIVFLCANNGAFAVE
jgi:hypothetical protein